MQQDKTSQAVVAFFKKLAIKSTSLTLVATMMFIAVSSFIHTSIVLTVEAEENQSKSAAVNEVIEAESVLRVSYTMPTVEVEHDGLNTFSAILKDAYTIMSYFAGGFFMEGYLLQSNENGVRIVKYSEDLKVQQDFVAPLEEDTSLAQDEATAAVAVTEAVKDEPKAAATQPAAQTIIEETTVEEATSIVYGDSHLTYERYEDADSFVIEHPTEVETTQEPTSVAYISAASVDTISEKKAPDDLWLDSNGVPVGYTKIIKGNASAYSGYGLTSTGSITEQGSVAVDPRIIPYGTKMWIVSDDGKYIYGYSEAEDTGGFIYWRRAPIADLFMYSERTCNQFGRRDITIYILP